MKNKYYVFLFLAVLAFTWQTGAAQAGSTHIQRGPCNQFNLGNDTTYCSAFSRVLSSGLARTRWSTGDTGVQITVTTAGLYWATDSSSCGRFTDTIILSQAAIPAAFNLGPDSTYCGNFVRTLSTGFAYTKWSTGATGPAITVTTPGIYSAVDSNQCGVKNGSITLSSIPYPSVNFGQDTTVCSGIEIVLDAGNAGAIYQWQDNSTSQTYTVTQPGTYSVIVTVNGCSGLHTTSISYIGAPPRFTLGSDATICDDAGITLNAYQPGVGYYLWNTGDTTSSITVSQAGKYYVTDSNACGKAVDSITIATKRCGCNLLIPTAFSPNNDGKNDEFGVIYRCPVQIFTMSIYNRWGEPVYTTHDVTSKWDGAFKGLIQPMGVYIYTITYTDPYTFEEKSLRGNVTLLR